MEGRMSPGRVGMIGAAICACLIALAVAAPAGAASKAPRIQVLSNRADLISGGDALVRVTLPKHAKVKKLRLRAGKRNVTKALSRTGKRQLEGLVSGMRNGSTKLVARVRGGRSS